MHVDAPLDPVSRERLSWSVTAWDESDTAEEPEPANCTAEVRLPDGSIRSCAAGFHSFAVTIQNKQEEN